MFYELAEKALALERGGRKIVRLNIGDTNLPAPQCAVEAAAKSIRGGRAGYGSSAGMHELRQAIAQRENCDAANVVVGPGSKHLIYALMSVLAKKSVAFPSPHWPMYNLAARQLGLEAKVANTTLEGQWQFDSIPRADLAIICNPLNPTSTIYREASMRRAIAQAAENGTEMIIDEAYRGIAFEKIPSYDAIRVRSFSKEFNMESWRLAYAVAPAEVIKKVIGFNQITSTCVPHFVQEAGIACLENEKEILGRNLRIWRKRSDAACRALAAKGFRFAKPQSGIYVFATHEGIADSGEYCMRLLGKGVAVAPGSEFGNYGKFVRICANQPEDVLEKAIEKMGEAAEGNTRN